jgi:hypothetical protein
MSSLPEPLIPPHGGYRSLKSYRNAEIVYDATARFCDRFIDRRSRTHDQMVQAARSGKQNIAEGSMASAPDTKLRPQSERAVSRRWLDSRAGSAFTPP